MPIAAVPKYLQRWTPEDTSPGMRFSLLLPLWTTREDQENHVHKMASAHSREAQELKESLGRSDMDTVIRELVAKKHRGGFPGLWEKNDAYSHAVWNQICTLNAQDKKRMQACLLRQRAAFASIPKENAFQIEASSTAPFATGLGNEHPLENGFSFLSPYGLPYLPGSGIKGVLRQAVRELLGEWKNAQGWTEESLTLLLGKEGKDADTGALQGALRFWDVVPQIAGDHLTVEILTPHQSEYYQGKSSPHDSGSPIPNKFLTVPPKSSFVFFVACQKDLLERNAPELVQEGRWKDLIDAAFRHAFEWLGFGAKTSVGYGAMLSDKQRSEQEARRAEAAQRAKEERLAQNAVLWEKAKITFNRRNGTLTVEKDGKSAFAIAPDGEDLLHSLPQEIQDNIRGNRFQRVTAYVSNTDLLRVEAE